MKQSFDILNDIFDWCCADEELCDLLDIDTSLTGLDQLKVQNDKLRREYQTADVIEHKDIPFISFYFMHSEKTKSNWLVNVGDLYIDIYADNMHSISLIAKRFRKIVSSKMEILLNYEGQHYSGVNGVYKYRLIYNPLIDGE